MIGFIRKSLDPYRMTAYASNTAARANTTPQNDPVTFCDVTFINAYSKNPESFRKVSQTLRARWPEKPVFYSEFGVDQIGASSEARIPHVEAIWSSISSEPYVIGGALWTFNDYRSDFKGTPASGNREWGVVTVDRKPKAAYEQVRRLYSPVRSLTIAGGKIRIEPRSPAEIPSYTLRAYRLNWEVVSSDGMVKSRGTIPLPDIRPGDSTWETRLPDPNVSTICLITPTGYDVDTFSSNSR